MRVPTIVTRLVVLVAAGLFIGRVDAAERRDDDVSAWIERMADRFEANPEWMNQRGTGWKPFQRLKWFHEQRMVNGQDPPVGARWNAWEEKRLRSGIRVLPYVSSWFSLGPANFAGRMLALAFDPSNSNVLYAGAASGGLWKSTDRGVTWTPMTDSQPTLAVGGVAVLPSNPDVVIIGTGEGTLNIDRVGGVGILKSTNGGVTWNTTSLDYSIVQGHGFHFVSVNPIRGTLLAGATDGMWRSSDDGDTWTKVSPPTSPDGNYYSAVWKPGHADSVFTCKGYAPGSNVKISTDDGLTWTRSGNAPGGNGKTKLAVTAADPDMIYAIVVNQSQDGLKGVYRSTNGGANWSLRTDVPNMVGAQGWYNLSLAVDPNDANRVIAGGVPLYRSTNGGTSFSEIGPNVHVDHHDIAYVPGSNSTVFVATDGGIWESTNDGSSWIDRNSGLVTYQFYDICVNNHPTVPNFLMGGTQDQGTDKWSGSTIWNGGLGGDGMVCNISPHNGTTVYAEIQFGSHWKSTNSGASWAQINSGIPAGNNQWVVPVDQDVIRRRRLYTNHSGAGIYKTTTGGSSWFNVASHTATWISVSPVNSDVVWTAGATTRVSTDDGANWTQAAPFPGSPAAVTKILAHPTDVNSALVSFSGYGAGLPHVMLTTDLGASWQDVTGDLPNEPVNAIAVDPAQPTHWFVGTDVSVWVTINGGLNWVPFDTGLPNAVVCDLEIQTATRKLFCGTHGRGAWEIDITSVTSLDPEDDDDPEPDVELSALRVMLDPPRPNPARDEVTLRFAARHDGEVLLEIYDLAGRRVTEVTRAARGDGIIRRATWYVDDVPSGVYFAVLTAGDSRTTRKLVVAK